MLCAVCIFYIIFQWMFCFKFNILFACRVGFFSSLLCVSMILLSFDACMAYLLDRTQSNDSNGIASRTLQYVMHRFLNYNTLSSWISQNSSETNVMWLVSCCVVRGTTWAQFEFRRWSMCCTSVVRLKLVRCTSRSTESSNSLRKKSEEEEKIAWTNSLEHRNRTILDLILFFMQWI